MPIPDADRALSRIASKQHQRFTRDQALGAGYSVAAVRHKLETGRWTKESRTVYALAGAPGTWDGRLWVALLACPDAAGSHLTAAFLHGLTEHRPAIIDLSLADDKKGPRLPGVRFHRVTWLDAMVRGGLRVTTVARTIVDLADTPHLEPLFDAAVDRRKISVDRMKAYVGPLKTNPGLRRLRQLLDDRQQGRLPGELERRFDALLKRSALPYPARQHPIGSRFADFAYAEERIVVELDGGDSHMRKAVFEDDRARQNEFVLRGWTILRFTWDDVTKRPQRVVRTIGQMLAISSRNRDGSRPPDAASPYGG